MGDVVSGITEGLGLTADTSAGAGANAGAQALEARAVRELEKLDIPDIEKQKILLELPKLVGLMQAEQLDPSALQDLEMDPQLRDNIMQAISAEKQLADEGLTAEDRARRDALLRSAQADTKARDASIMQSMAEEGRGGSGSELAQRLLSNQRSADRAEQQAAQLGADISRARREARQNAANMSSQLDATQFARDAQKASAADEIARFNAMNRQNIAAQNLAQQQSIADQGTALRNQQQMYNKGLQQQQFQNQMAKATGVTNQLQNQAQGMQAQANRQAQAAQAQAAGNRSLIGSGITALALSDKKAKENVREAKTDEFQDMLDKIKPKKFDYKMEHGGVRDNTGVMAQDLEKSDLGRDMVVDTPEGKMVDKEKMLMTAMATLADMNKRMKELEKGSVGEKPSKDTLMEGKPAPKEDRVRMQDVDIDVAKLLEELQGVKMPSQYADGSKFDTVADVERSTQMIADEMMQDAARKQNILKNIGSSLQQSEVPAASNNVPQKIKMDPNQFLRNPYTSKFAEGGTESPASYTDGGERVDELLDEGALEINRDAQEDLMEFLRGNKEAEDMEGRIVEGDSFSGDLLPDRINSGELVANVGQQHRVKDKLMDQEAKARGFNKLLDMLGKNS